MPDYIWGGTSGANVGKFGPLTKGDVVNLTTAEALAVVGNTDWAAKPTIQDKKFKYLATAATLTNADTGVVIISTHTAPVTYTLPAAPTVGVSFDFQFGNGAVGDITIGRNGKNIDGAATDLTLAIATVLRTGVYYNGTQWVSYTS